MFAALISRLPRRDPGTLEGLPRLLLPVGLARVPHPPRDRCRVPGLLQEEEVPKARLQHDAQIRKSSQQVGIQTQDSTQVPNADHCAIQTNAKTVHFEKCLFLNQDYSKVAAED